MYKKNLFATRLLTWAMVAALMLVAGACSKREDLIDKAFQQNRFEQRLESEVNKDPVEEPTEESKGETAVEVLVDNLKQKSETSTFQKTGTEEHPVKEMFPGDAEAPALKLEDAQLFDVIDILCKSMNINYILDPSVKDQTITISMVEGDTKIKISELLDLLLKLHDLTMIKRGNFLFIAPIASPEVNPGLEILYGTQPNNNLRREELAIQIIPLKYVKPADMANVVKDFMSPSGRVLEESRNNLLILIDKYQFISKIMELIPTFDVDVLGNKRMSFYELAHVDAVETGDKLAEILSVYGYDQESERLKMIPIETLNGILVVADSEEIFKELDYWMKKFDQEAQFEEETIFIYHVEYTTADSIANTITQLFGFQTSYGGTQGGFGGGSNPISRRRTTDPNRDPSGRTSRTNNNQRGGATGTNNNPAGQNANGTINSNQRGQNQVKPGEGPIMIVDVENNALVFQTTPREYARVRKVLKKLDILPRQVFLEVAVLSVSYNDAQSIGVAWGANNNATANPPSNPNSVAGNFGGGDGDSSSFGLAYSYTAATNQIQASISAAKNRGYVNVLQQPHIMAIDNKAASISVGSDVPIATTTTNINQITDGSSVTPASSSTIQYRQTGVSLSFTPHINANGVIRMTISLDLSEAGAQSSSAQAVPISSNNLETEMIVRDGQTVVMGGLIFDQEQWSRDTVPFVERIPLLRHLFTDRSSSNSKRELIVTITPRLVDSEEKSIAISKEFKEKILEEFKSFKRSRY